VLHRAIIRGSGPRVLESEHYKEGPTMTQNMTLLDLVDAVSDQTQNETETIATVVYLVNSGRVRLCGNFKGARFDVRALTAA